MGIDAWFFAKRPTRYREVVLTPLRKDIGEFVRKLRIEHACAELMKGDVPLTAIALQAGFVDQSHFSKVFKLYVGMTPRKYRNIVRSS